jgi:Glycosyltransferase family 87
VVGPATDGQARSGKGTVAIGGGRGDAVALVALAAILLGLSGFLAWEVPRISHVTAAHTDFIETVYGLRAFVAGHDPYGDAVAAQVDALMAGHPLPAPPGGHYEHPFLYPLAPALVYLPFTALPDEPAIIATRAVTVALYLAALLALIWRFAGALPAAARAGLVLLGVAWWPFLSVILPIVQQSGAVFALLVLATLAAERGRWSWAAVAAYISLIKPTESAPVVLLLAVWALRTPAARRPFGLGLAAVALPTAALAFAVRPTWPADWLRVLASLRAGHFDYNVDLIAALAQRVHMPVDLLWAGALAVVGALAALAWRNAGRAAKGGADAGIVLWWWVGLTCVLTLIVVPRTGAYDIVIGLVAWYVALRAAGQLPRARRYVAYASLMALLTAAGLLAYRDHAAAELPALALALGVALWLCRPPTLRTNRLARGVEPRQMLAPAEARS